MRSKTFRALLALALLAPVLPAVAQTAQPTAAMDGKWHFTVIPYVWMTGIKGDVSVANLVEVPVDASFSDILSDFDFGLQGHFEARKNRIGFAVDVMYTNLGVPVASSAPVVGRLDLHADVRQTFAEGLFLYRVAQGGRADNPANLDVLAGGRYTNTRTRLTATGPAGIEYDGDSQDLDWVDALAGVRFRAPLGSRLAFLGRADVAGFGSKLTWNLEGDLAFRAGDRWAIGAGWRHLDIDYEEDGAPAKQFDIAYDGPRVWFAYAW